MWQGDYHLHKIEEEKGYFYFFKLNNYKLIFLLICLNNDTVEEFIDGHE